MSAGRLRQTIEIATGFLHRQLSGGSYGMSCLGSDGTPRFSHEKGHIFTGFFVAAALDGFLTEVERTVLLSRILSEENKGLWGYSPPAPYVSPEHEVFVVDADDSAYVFRTLRALGVGRSPEALARFHRGNLFATFAAREQIAMVTEPSVENNLMAHPEVNANVFTALRGTPLEGLINTAVVRETQAGDGHWPSYFYPSPFFATYLFLDFIQDQDGLKDVERRGTRFILDRQESNGSWGSPPDAYETALAANALARCGETGEPLRKATTYLADTMAADGSWQTSECIWRFHATDADVWEARDSHRILTSALCTLALRRADVSWKHRAGP